MHRPARPDAAMNGPEPQVSIVVPTYGEADNLQPLTELISETLAAAGLSWELIIANDESGDATVEVCGRLEGEYPVRLLNRTANRGLSYAVIDGAELARGKVIVVMDADMSHPPAAIVEMVRLLEGDEADMVMGSRNVAGGRTDESWSLFRHLNTFVATSLARPLVAVRDPMSGFFALRREDWPASERLDPIGYKIALDIMVRARFARARIREIPIYFADRRIGESKLTAREQLKYLRHLHRLYRFRWPRLAEFMLFALIGTSGVIIDVGVYLPLVAIGVHHEIARAISYWPATVWNGMLNRNLTFRKRPRRPVVRQMIFYSVVASIGFLVNWGCYALLTRNVDFFAQYKVLALIVGILAGMMFTFSGAHKLVFSSRAR